MEKRSYHIGFVSLWYARGQAYVTRLLRQALCQQHRTFVFARGGGPEAQQPDGSGEWQIENLTAFQEYQIPPARLKAWIEENRIDLVVFNEEYDFNLVKAAREAGAAILGYYVWELFQPRWFHIVRSLFDIVICPTRASYEHFRRLGIDNARFLRWAIDPEFQAFLDARAQQASGPASQPVRFFHPAGWGGIYARRGTQFVIDAFKLANLENASLLIHTQHGNPGEETQGNIRVIRGTLPRRELAQLYSTAGIAVLPSKWEGLGLTFLEAIAAQLPILTVDAPPMNEFVEHGQTGFLCQVGSWCTYEKIFVPGAHVDIDDLAVKMRALADNPELRQRMAAQTGELASRFSFQRFQSTLEAFVAEIMDSMRGAVRLNLGCGEDIRPGYVNCDMRKLPGVDCIEDVSRLSYENETVTEILANDIIEHFPYAESEKVLAEWVRVLRPGGRLRLQTPDCRQLSRFLLSNQIPTQEFVRRIYGGQTYEGNFHFAGFDRPGMRRLLHKLGLRVLEMASFNGNMGITAIKPERPAPAKLKVILISARFSNYPWGTGNFIHKALTALGHDVIDIDFRRDAARMEKMLSEPADLVLIYKGSNVNPEWLEPLASPVILWYPDDFLQAAHARQDVLRLSYACDHIFYFDAHGLRALQASGISHSSFLPLATDPTVYRLVPGTPKKYDIVFVGTMYPNRRTLIERLSRRFNVVVRQAYMEEMVQLFNEAKIVLNLGVGRTGYPLRVFEALGCGAFVLTNAIPEDQRLFRDKEHLVYFDDSNLEELAAYYLDHEAEREAIAERGYREVVAKHTFVHRLHEMLHTVGFFEAADAARDAVGMQPGDGEPLTPVRAARACSAQPNQERQFEQALLQAMQHEQNGDIEASIHALEQSPQIPAFAFDRHYELGRLCFLAGHYKAASEHFAVCTRENPAEHTAWNNRAVSLYRAGKLTEAGESIQQALLANAEEAGLYYNLAKICETSQDTHKVRALLERATYFDSEFSPAWQLLDTKYREIRQKSADENVQRAGKKKPRRGRKKLRVLYLTPPGLGDNPTPETVAAEELRKLGHAVTLVKTSSDEEPPEGVYDVIYVAMHPSAIAGWNARARCNAPIYVHLEGCPWWRIGLDDPTKWGYSEEEAQEIRERVPQFRRYYRKLCELTDAADYRDAAFPAHIRAAEFLLEKKLNYPLRGAMFDLTSASQSDFTLQEEYRIVSMTRLVPDKFMHHVARALTLLENPPVWSIIGYGPDREKIEKIVAGTRVKIEFMGALYGVEKFNEIRRAMFGVNLRAGVPPAELLYMDRTNISYYSYIRQLWDDDIVYFTPFSDIERLAEKIQYVIDHPEERQERAQVGKQKLLGGELKTKPAPLFARELEEILYGLC